MMKVGRELSCKSGEVCVVVSGSLGKARASIRAHGGRRRRGGGSWLGLECLLPWETSSIACMRQLCLCFSSFYVVPHQWSEFEVEGVYVEWAAQRAVNVEQ